MRKKLFYNFIFTNRKKGLTLWILMLSAFYRLCILLIPMKYLSRGFGHKGQESEEEVSFEYRRIAFWIGERVERVCDKTPWQSKCLVKALIAQQLLKRKKIPTTLYLGMGKKEDSLTAHAWLRCGSVYVTGGDGSDYVMVAKFSI
jgi:hypothetical protein